MSGFGILCPQQTIQLYMSIYWCSIKWEFLLSIYSLLSLLFKPKIGCQNFVMFLYSVLKWVPSFKWFKGTNDDYSNYMTHGFIEHQTLIITSPSLYKNTLSAKAMTSSTANISIQVLYCLSSSLLIQLYTTLTNNPMPWQFKCQHAWSNVNYVLLRFPHDSNTVSEFEFMQYTTEFVFICLSA